MKKTAKKKAKPSLLQQKAAQQGRPLRKDDEDTIALVANIVEAASAYVRKYHRRVLGRPPKMGILDTELFHECLRILAAAEQGTVGVGVPLAKDIKTIVDGALESVAGPN
jgi:hypothetical protein